MAKTLSELLDETEKAVDDAKARVDADEAVDQQSITDLKAEVARLQAIIDQGQATPAQEQRFADLKTKLDALEAAAPPA